MFIFIEFNFFLENGSVLLWGSNDDGSLGVGSTDENVLIPSRVVELDNVRVTKVECGLLFSCALTASGAIYTWGANLHGELGIGSTEPVFTKPQQIKPLSTISIEGAKCSNNHMVVWTGKYKYLI